MEKPYLTVSRCQLNTGNVIIPPMLSVFPSLFTLSLLGPTILRLTVGLFFVNFGWLKLTTEREKKAAFFETIGLKPGRVFVIFFGFVELVGGLFLVAGFLTQVAALVFIIILIGTIVAKHKQPESLSNESRFYLLLLVAALTLLFTGAGLFAVDLPL